MQKIHHGTTKRARCLYAAVALAALLFVQPAAGQHLTMPSPPGYVLAYDATQGGNLVREFVPQGQTIENYATMISSHRLAGLGRVPSADFVAGWAKRYLARCPGGTAAAVPLGTAGGIRVDCLRHPATGKPETVIARAIGAGPDMFLVFITFRFMPMPGDTQWARDLLGKIAIES
jgi:hypothetical protein